MMSNKTKGLWFRRFDAPGFRSFIPGSRFSAGDRGVVGRDGRAYRRKKITLEDIDSGFFIGWRCSKTADRELDAMPVHGSDRWG